LSVAGFSAVEIADILQTTAAVVHQHLYAMRKKKAK
jgi:DNA-directed RNA polymerase specialized sigma24 family protein